MSKMIYVVFEKFTNKLITVSTDRDSVKKEFKNPYKYSITSMTKGDEIMISNTNYKYEDLIRDYLS